MSKRLSRRRFLQASAVGAAGFWSGRALAADKNDSPSERLRVAVVGVAGKGDSNWTACAAAGAEVVAFCDIDENRIGKIRERFPKATFTPDFRKLFDQKGFDAAIISTPDHTHAPATLAALRAGLHVFCEKPLTHTVQEARLVAETAAKQKRVTQMGTQVHAGNNYRRVVELIQANSIGPVREVHVWCGKSYGAGERPKETEPIPSGLHWDLWIGPAPERPFHHGPDKKKFGTYHPFNWRSWWDFGGGTLNDMACHYVDLPFWALKLRHPTRVSAEGNPTPPRAETAADQLVATYDFPARDSMPAVKLTWYDGGKRPPQFADGTLPKWGDGVLFIGDKGMLLCDYSNHRLLPEKDFEGFTKPKPTIPDSVGHYKEWVDACKTGGPTTCNFDYSGALTESVLLGTVSYRTGKPIEWDAKNLKALNAPEADKYIRKTYRKGWEL